LKKNIQVEKSEPLVLFADNIVYTQKSYWCNGSARQLSLSFMGKRQYYTYDQKGDQPLIIFLCGGGFTKMDRNVWMAELAWFAKKGYSVASIDYSTLPYTVWPEQITELKLAIRFLRAHAKDFHIQSDKVAIMGESAGGYLASFVALTNGQKEYDTGDYLEFSSKVQAVIPWYGASKMSELIQKNPQFKNFPDLDTLVLSDAPPFLLLHGTADNQVHHRQSELLYEALISAGVQVDLYLIEGANHGDISFAQIEIKEIILSFLNRNL
jgi:acetyl esterase/lipase